MVLLGIKLKVPCSGQERELVVTVCGDDVIEVQHFAKGKKVISSLTSCSIDFKVWEI